MLLKPLVQIVQTLREKWDSIFEALCLFSKYMLTLQGVHLQHLHDAKAKHYTGRGVMKFYPSGEDLAKDMGVPLQTLIDTHQKHYEAAKKQEKDPDGGSFPAYPSGKTWDEPSGKTGSGKLSRLHVHVVQKRQDMKIHSKPFD